MKKGMYVVTLMVFSLFLVMAGCQKEATKVTPEPGPAVEKPEPKPETEEKEKKQEKTAESEAKKQEKIPLSFQTVHFEFDKYNISPDQRDVLAHDAQVLKAYPEVKVLISGHCDERGTTEYNLALGQKRANTVKNYLENYGIDGSRLSTISYGEEQPVAEGHNEAAWAKNRRAEFKITQR